MDERYAAAAAAAATEALTDACLTLADIDAVVLAPPRPEFRSALARHLGLPDSRVVVADDEHIHTAALVAGLDAGGRRAGTRTLIIAAGAGVTAGAAVYAELPANGSHAFGQVLDGQ